MNTINFLFYGVMTTFNLIPLKMFRRLCERYVNSNDDNVSSVLAGYITVHQLTASDNYTTPEYIEENLDMFLQGSKLEVLFQLNSPKLWNLFVESVSARQLSLPEQLILVKKLPDEYFCKLYVNREEKVSFFDRQIGLAMFNSCKTIGISTSSYQKLQWYVRYCKLSYLELKCFLDLFVAEAVKDSPEPKEGFCALFREWMMSEGAEKKDFASYDKMLDYGLTEMENIQRRRDLEIKAMQYSEMLHSDWLNA